MVEKKNGRGTKKTVIVDFGCGDTNQRKGTLRDWGRQKKDEDPEFSLKSHKWEHAELVEARRLFRQSGVLKEYCYLDLQTNKTSYSKNEIPTSASSSS